MIHHVVDQEDAEFVHILGKSICEYFRQEVLGDVVYQACVHLFVCFEELAYQLGHCHLNLLLHSDLFGQELLLLVFEIVVIRESLSVIFPLIRLQEDFYDLLRKRLKLLCG